MRATSAAIANSVADSGGGGNPSYFGYTYMGPMINTDGTNVCGPDHPELCQYTSPEAMEIVFDWFDSVGGLSNTDLWYAAPSISGVNTLVENLASPYADEYTVGFSKRLGNKGMIRADIVHREYHDFYSTVTDLSTGTVNFNEEVAPGVVIDEDFDLSIVRNEDNQLKREYNGLHLSAQYRFNDKLQVGGTYSYSKVARQLRRRNRRFRPGLLGCPELPRVRPGELSERRRPRQRPTAETACMAGVGLRLHLEVQHQRQLARELLHRFTLRIERPSPRGRRLRLVVRGSRLSHPPLWNTTWFEPRDTYRTDNVHSTDLALNFGFFIGKSVEIFIQPEVINVFNESAGHDVNTKIDTRGNGCPSSVCQYFNPFDASYTPVEGLDWVKGPNFGEPHDEGDLPGCPGPSGCPWASASDRLRLLTNPTDPAPRRRVFFDRSSLLR